MVDFIGGVNKVPLFEAFDFTVDEVTEILQYIGLIDGNCSCREEQMEKYIFLYGDEQEVYNREERDFIEAVGNIFIYQEFHKKTKRGTMPCRVIATEFENIEPLKGCIFFMKEINKAIGGYTIFFIKANKEFYIGMRLFNHDVKDDCMVSNPIVTCEDMEEIWNKLMFVPDSDEFLDYYNAMASVIEASDENYEDYDAQIVKRRGIQYPYLQMLSDIEKTLGVSMTWEKLRYYNSFDTVLKKDFLKYFKEACLELDFVKSFKANTMEMLFEAEEMARMATETVEEHNLLLSVYREGHEVQEDDSDMKECLDDPELMIKILKQKRGI